MLCRVEAKDAIARAPVSPPADQVDGSVQHQCRCVGDRLRKVSDDGRMAGRRVVLLDQIGVCSRRKLATEGVDPSAEGGRRRIANSCGEVPDRSQTPPVGRPEHRRKRTRAVIAAEYVGGRAIADSGDVRGGEGQGAGLTGGPSRNELLDRVKGRAGSATEYEGATA